MALSRYTVERYRCFVEPTTIEVRPLTLLFGKNSAGKSALARALPLLAASAKLDEGGPLALSSAEARGASYSDIASRLSARNALVFSLQWDDGEGGPSRVELQLRDMPEQHRHIVEEFRAEVNGRELKLRYEPTHGEDKYELSWAGKISVRPAHFAGIRAVVSKGSRDLLTALSEVDSRLGALGNAVHWLNAVRASIPRTKPVQRGVRLGLAGENVEQILAEDWERGRSLIDRINRSYAAMFQQEIRIETTVAGVSVGLVPIEGPPIFTALADTGEGASQALPVFVLGALAETGQLGTSPLLVIEQPEMHLHPAAEKELASFLCGVSKAKDVRLVVETHSENLLLFVYLAIAKGILTPSDVAVYYIRPLHGGGGSIADRIEIDEVGRSRNWPPGVFSEDVEMAREIFLARRHRESST